MNIRWLGHAAFELESDGTTEECSSDGHGDNGGLKDQAGTGNTGGQPTR